MAKGKPQKHGWARLTVPIDNVWPEDDQVTLLINGQHQTMSIDNDAIDEFVPPEREPKPSRPKKLFDRPD